MAVRRTIIVAARRAICTLLKLGIAQIEVLFDFSDKCFFDIMTNSSAIQILLFASMTKYEAILVSHAICMYGRRIVLNNCENSIL